MKQMYKSGTRDVKVVFRKFREQTTSEREALIQKHTSELEEYLMKTRHFVENLPKSRLPDYNLLKSDIKKKRSKSSSDDEHRSKRVKSEKRL